MSIERVNGSFIYEDSDNEFLREAPMPSMFRVCCDVCGKHLPMQDGFDAAIASGKKAGWKAYHNDVFNEWENVCPDCQEFYEANTNRTVSAASDFEGVGNG